MSHRTVVVRRFSPEKIVEIWERLGDGQSVRSIAIGLGRFPSVLEREVISPEMVLISQRPAENVRVKMTQKIMQLPGQLRKSITWNRGKEEVIKTPTGFCANICLGAPTFQPTPKKNLMPLPKNLTTVLDKPLPV